jgi:fatty-acyl-CoA synthase
VNLTSGRIGPGLKGGSSVSRNAPRTTKYTRPISTIADIVALERLPYNTVVSARNIYHLFGATAQLHPERPALTVLLSGNPEERTVSLSHKELLEDITRSANLFRSLGISPDGGVVAFLCPALPQVMPALIGAQVAGVASSINFLLNTDAVVDLLIAEKATVLVIPSAMHDVAIWERANAVIHRVPSLEKILVIGETSELSRKFIGFDESVSRQRNTLSFSLTEDRNSICALFHTGGTTGRPKLARLTHRNLIHAAWSFAQVHGLDEFDTVINGFPLFHVGGTVTVGLSVLAAGGHVIIPSPYGFRVPQVIQNHWRIAETFQTTIVAGVPTTISAFAEVPVGHSKLNSVRMAITGGSVLPKAVGERFEKRTGIRIFETYGMTETAAAIAFNPGRGEPLAGSVGFRAPYAETMIAKFGSEGTSPESCAPLTSGLVLVRGPQVFSGYLDPKHNEGVLTEHGWLITGDIGYLTEDERLVLTGRAKDLIIRSGHNIDPAAIEDVANNFPGVQISAAVGMPDQYAGEVPILFVVPAPGQSIDVSALDAHLERNILEPPAKPKRVVVLERLPVTAVGKIFKPALRELAIEEKAKLEIDRIFGESAGAEIKIEKDDKLNARVRIIVNTRDDVRLRELAQSLLSLPQSYSVESHPNAHE